MGVGGELNGAVYPAVSTLKPDPWNHHHCLPQPGRWFIPANLVFQIDYRQYCFVFTNECFYHLFSAFVSFAFCPPPPPPHPAPIITTQSMFSRGYCFPANYTYLWQLSAPMPLTNTGARSQERLDSFLKASRPTKYTHIHRAAHATVHRARSAEYFLYIHTHGVSCIYLRCNIWEAAASKLRTAAGFHSTPMKTTGITQRRRVQKRTMHTQQVKQSHREQQENQILLLNWVCRSLPPACLPRYVSLNSSK